LSETRLFEETPDERGARLLEEQRTKAELKERLAGIERGRIAVMHRLAEIGETQKAAQREMRAHERELKAALKDAPEYGVPEDRELSQEDVEAWCRSEFFIMAHTAPRNPHCYFSKKKVRRPDMYKRVAAFVLENGYEQKYGGESYTVLDVKLNGTRWYLWPMTTIPEESEVLNLKPDSMRPSQG